MHTGVHKTYVNETCNNLPLQLCFSAIRICRVITEHPSPRIAFIQENCDADLKKQKKAEKKRKRNGEKCPLRREKTHGGVSQASRIFSPTTNNREQVNEMPLVSKQR